MSLFNEILAGISKHSGGCIHHFPLYQKTKQHMVDSLTNCFKRYLVRKIGFEAVMRVRCTRGLQVHTFHGNFFVRSTDLLSLPNVNPDAGYGMQVSRYYFKYLKFVISKVIVIIFLLLLDIIRRKFK